jgi:hypothetical protein
MRPLPPKMVQALAPFAPLFLCLSFCLFSTIVQTRLPSNHQYSPECPEREILGSPYPESCIALVLMYMGPT